MKTSDGFQFIQMKTNYKIILVGLLLFILGIVLMKNDDYRDFLYDIHPDLEIVGFLVAPTSGLVMMGLGVMLEFGRRKYEIRK